MRALVLILVLIALIGYSSGSLFSSEPTINLADDFLTVESKKSYFEYDFSAGTQHFSSHVIYLEKASGLVRDAGFAFSGSFLDQAAFAEFEQIKAQGRCPAGFLNQHATNYLFIVPEKRHQALLMKSQGKDRGIALEFSGHELSFAMGEYKGVPMTTFNFGRSVPFLLTDLREY